MHLYARTSLPATKEISQCNSYIIQITATRLRSNREEFTCLWRHNPHDGASWDREVAPKHEYVSDLDLDDILLIKSKFHKSFFKVLPVNTKINLQLDYRSHLESSVTCPCNVPNICTDPSFRKSLSSFSSSIIFSSRPSRRLGKYLANTL